MQISDIMYQYQRNLETAAEQGNSAANAQVSTTESAASLKQTMDLLKFLAVGNIFEGTILKMENGMASIGLADGKQIDARLDGSVSVQNGQSMFFQVKSAQDNQIAIRIVSTGAEQNPKLLQALSAAGLPVNEKNLNMVLNMMQESMSIDKQSLLDMSRLMSKNPDIPVTTLVQMTKSGLPISAEMAQQFENYKSDQHSLLSTLGKLMDQIPEQSSIQTGKQILAMLYPDASSVPKTAMPVFDEQLSGTASTEKGLEKVQTSETGSNQISQNQIVQDQAGAGVRSEAQQISSDLQVPERPGSPAVVTVGEGWKILLSRLPEEIGQSAVLKDLQEDGTVRLDKLMSVLTHAVTSKDEQTRQIGERLLSTKEFSSLLKNALEEQWLIRPEKVSKEEVSSLYDRMLRQTSALDQIFSQTGQNTHHLTDLTASIRQNLNFMQNIQQVFQYVQIPLKLNRQNAHGELYVYSGNRRNKEESEELSAFLHLDLENLGSTDVSVRMKQKQITTNFYLEEESSAALILAHLPQLQHQLEKKGFQTTITVINQGKKPDFLEEIMNQEQGGRNGALHRYSFDVRA